MGWASGSRIFAAVVRTAKKNVKDPELRYRIYKELIPVFEEDADCDTLGDLLSLVSPFDEKSQDAQFDRAFLELNPDFDDDEDEEK